MLAKMTLYAMRMFTRVLSNLDNNKGYDVNMHETIEERIRRNNIERRELMLESVENSIFSNGQKFVDKGIPQSMLFMLEIIPIIHRLYDHLPEGTYKSAVDIGPQNFAGTALLSQIHAKESFCRLKLEITAVDIEENFELLRQIVAPEIEFILSDIYNLTDRSWDFSIASHVIEHVPDPLKFVHRLQEISKDFVIIATPWNENPIITPGHVNTISKELVRDMGARDLSIFTNYSWGKNREVCTFWLPGLA